MLDHTGVRVSNLKKSRTFYDAAFKPLNISVLMDGSDGKFGGVFIGYGEGQKAFFWVAEKPPVTDPIHVAFTAESRAAVDKFYEAALKAGGRDNGPPGIRAHYHPNYYGAFVLDPDGHNIEAVCHKPM